MSSITSLTNEFNIKEVLELLLKYPEFSTLLADIDKIPPHAHINHINRYLNSTKRDPRMIVEAINILFECEKSSYMDLSYTPTYPSIVYHSNYEEVYMICISSDEILLIENDSIRVIEDYEVILILEEKVKMGNGDSGISYNVLQQTNIAVDRLFSWINVRYTSIIRRLIYYIDTASNDLSKDDTPLLEMIQISNPTIKHNALLIIDVTIKFNIIVEKLKIELTEYVIQSRTTRMIVV